MTEKQKNDVVGKKSCTDAAPRDPSAGPLPFCNDAWALFNILILELFMDQKLFKKIKI